MIYNVLKRMIERGQTDGLRDKLNIFFAKDQITEAQYEELTAMLDGE